MARKCVDRKNRILEISVGEKIIILDCTIYRSPSSGIMSFDVALETTVLNIKAGHEDLLVGDFNATSPNWCTTDLYNEAGLTFGPSFLSLGLQQCLTIPSHLRPESGLGSLLIWY